MELRLRFLFGDFSLDIDRRELRGRAGPISIEPQVFDLLKYLVDNRDRVVSKDDIMAAVWGGRIVSESAVTTRVNAARKAIGDSGKMQRFIKTLPRKGVRFIGAVSVRRGDQITSISVSTGQVAPVASPDRPSIAVLPFANFNGDPEQDYFVDGIVTEIIMSMLRMRWLSVKARSSSFGYNEPTIDVRQGGYESGARYVLEGDVRRSTNHVRITARLIEVAAGGCLWAESYENGFADTFLIQDEIAGRVLGAIEPELRLIERMRAANPNPGTLQAWDQFWQGVLLFHQFTIENNAAAESSMRKVIQMEPMHRRGHFGLAQVLIQRILWGWSKSIDRDKKVGYAAARRAVELDDKDPYAFHVLTWFSLFNLDYRMSVEAAQTAIDLAPNFAQGHFALGVASVFTGKSERAVKAFERARFLSPHEPLIFLYDAYFALTLYHQSRYEDAAKIALKAIVRRPAYLSCCVLAACYGRLDQISEGQAALAAARRLMPERAERCYREYALPYADPAYHAILDLGLRKVGWTGDRG